MSMAKESSAGRCPPQKKIDPQCPHIDEGSQKAHPHSFLSMDTEENAAKTERIRHAGRHGPTRATAGHVACDQHGARPER